MKKRLVLVALVAALFTACDSGYTNVLYGNTEKLTKVIHDYEPTDYVLHSKYDDLRFDILQHRENGTLIAKIFRNGSTNLYMFKSTNMEDLKKHDMVLERRATLETEVFRSQALTKRLAPSGTNNNNQTVNVFVNREETEAEKKEKARKVKIAELEKTLKELKGE
ncbi:MAG: hypothetical protein ACRDDH_11850 [Cetobacterium sp.]|uniref:hypothetical protein n=1 Tax=Cetobacterium sp. TaxID=2071632 RepID=UPI003EE59C08